MLIEFLSDDTDTGIGFAADYELDCGGLYLTPGFVKSPYYPNAYPKSRNCFYHIQGAAHNVIFMSFVTEIYIIFTVFFISI